MTYIHPMLVSKELGRAGLIGIHLASFLRTKGKECRLWIPGEGAALGKIKQLALKFNVYDASCVMNTSKMRAAIGNWKIWRDFYLYRPGIVHIHSLYHYKVLQMGIQMSGLKTVVHVHLQEAEEGLLWAFEKPPHVIVTCARKLSDYVRHTLPERFQEHQRIISIPNAVDIEQFYPGDKATAKQRIGAPHGILLVLMVANLAPHKGQETAIRAMAVLKKAKIDIACWFVGVQRQGEGDYITCLQELCNELEVADRIRFLGHRENVPDILRAADIFLLPSTNEGLPLSVLEAQATKVPVLADPTAGIPEVITDGETGFLIPAKDAIGYAQRIENLLNYPDLHQRVQEQAHAKVIKEHNWHTYCETVGRLYHSVMRREYSES